jgi:RNA polymerase sigma-70 factor (ECF subfamily)
LNELSDKKLVIVSQSGDQKAYAVLAQRYMKDVFGMCLGRLGNVHDAEDVTQEVFVKGYVRIHQLRHGDKYRSWLMRMGRNLCTDLQRRKKHSRESSLENRPVSAPQPDASDDRFRRLKAALQLLPERYRTVLMQFYFKQCNVNQVAESLHLSVNAVNTHLHRARQLLKQMLSEQGGQG